MRIASPRLLKLPRLRAVKHLSELAIAFRHIQMPFYPDLDKTGIWVVSHAVSSCAFRLRAGFLGSKCLARATLPGKVTYSVPAKADFCRKTSYPTEIMT